MARIGELDLGSCKAVEGRSINARSAIAFALNYAPRSDFLYAPVGSSWEVELKSAQRSVVARSTDQLEPRDILTTGLEYVQQCLDIVAFEKRCEAFLVNPANSHIVQFDRGSSLVVQHVDMLKFPVDFRAASLTIRDADDNVKVPQILPPVWTPALRFYRLSQVSRDLYDAYRNLFLGLEAMLNTVAPQSNDEREQAWLLRSLSSITQTANLQQLIPAGAKDPAAYIVGTQYDHIRCRLFHAKPSSGGELLDLPNPAEVESAYERLVVICRRIAETCLSVRRGGGGLVTYYGFKSMMDNALSQNPRMHYREIKQSPTGDDAEINVSDGSFRAFDTVTYLGETEPGRVAVEGSFRVRDAAPVIRLICTSTDLSLLAFCEIVDGLDVSGVDTFEFRQAIRLFNQGMPRTTFGDN
jgi:hypothetical protein